MKIHQREVRFDPDREPHLRVVEREPIAQLESQDAVVWNLVDKDGKQLHFPPFSPWVQYGLTVAFEGNSLLGPLTVLEQRPLQVIGMGNDGGRKEDFRYRVYFVRRRLDRFSLHPVQFMSHRNALMRRPGLPLFNPLNLEVTHRTTESGDVILEVSELLVEIFSGQSVSWLFHKGIRRALGEDYLPNIEFTNYDANSMLTPYGPFLSLSITRLEGEDSDFDFKVAGTLSSQKGSFDYNVVALALNQCSQLTVISDSDPRIDDLGPPPSGGG